VERRIAAILAADMVGFSRLMEADEVGTLERQKALLAESIDPKIVAHGGTVIKLTGDGLIAEFPSAVEAVKCAVSFQSDMFDREIDEPEERRIRYRVAINLGDVIFDEGDIYGDGVNIAARLEALAESGGIVVSGATYDMLKNQISVGYKFLGEKHLKNIETPVRVYQVIDTPEDLPIQSGKRLPKLVVSAAIAAVVLVVGLFFWWSLQPSITAADPTKIAFSLPEKPSIAISPFASASGGSLSSSLSEGLVASLNSTLTISPDIVVISPQSMSDMRGLSIAQIAEKYGVQYVVDGSVQVHQEKLRVTVRLSDALNGRSIWSDQWDRGTNDVFAVQDEITEKVFEELQVNLTLGEEARTLRD
jgi:class 3 adenylate cyclase/TolB-like protein